MGSSQDLFIHVVYLHYFSDQSGIHSLLPRCRLAFIPCFKIKGGIYVLLSFYSVGGIIIYFLFPSGVHSLFFKNSWVLFSTSLIK
jgi:hypothetical protein